jgi:phosphoglycolate phosphatase-like HAD superfamily hydrolase
LKFIIFDIDGTLTNTTDVDDRCYFNAFKKAFGEDIEDVNWAELKNVTDWGITEELVQLKLGREASLEELNRMKRIFFRLLKSEIEKDKNKFEEIPGAKCFFDILINKPNFKIGIATGGWEESAKIKLNAIGINPYDFCFSNSSCFKSREEISRDVIQQMETKSNKAPIEIFYFGDGDWDYFTTQKLGIKFIGIDINQSGKLAKLGATRVYTDYLDSEQILDQLNS